MFVNPNRSVLNPGDQVLISVGDEWLRTNPVWRISAGWISSDRGAYIQYTAPLGHGYVAVVVNATLYGQYGEGRVDFFIDG